MYSDFLILRILINKFCKFKNHVMFNSDITIKYAYYHQVKCSVEIWSLGLHHTCQKRPCIMCVTLDCRIYTCSNQFQIKDTKLTASCKESIFFMLLSNCSLHSSLSILQNLDCIKYLFVKGFKIKENCHWM